MKVSRVLALTLVFGASSACASGDSAISQKVLAVIERTKSIRTTYAVYNRNWIKVPGADAWEEWSAEFNSGALHRVETPRDRVIADCGAHTGAALSLLTGEITTGPDVAATACGISTSKPFLAGQWLGTVSTAFGKANRVAVTDASNIRTYDISPDGVILRTEFRQNNASKPVVLNDCAVALEVTLPGRDMFDEKSLRTSFVPEKFKAPPAQ